MAFYRLIDHRMKAVSMPHILQLTRRTVQRRKPSARCCVFRTAAAWIIRDLAQCKIWA